MARYKPKFTRTKDRNHDEIAGVYQGLGLSVYDASRIGGGFPDLVVGGMMPCAHCRTPIRQNLLSEIKLPGEDLRTGEKDRADQGAFHAAWRGPIVVVRTMDEALASVGRK